MEENSDFSLVSLKPSGGDPLASCTDDYPHQLELNYVIFTHFGLLKNVFFSSSPQHFQLALIDSNLCTLSKAESKSFCIITNTSNLVTSHTCNIVLDCMHQLVVRLYILKGHTNVSTERFLFFPLCCCFPADSS